MSEEFEDLKTGDAAIILRSAGSIELVFPKDVRDTDLASIEAQIITAIALRLHDDEFVSGLLDYLQEKAGEVPDDTIPGE